MQWLTCLADSQPLVVGMVLLWFGAGKGLHANRARIAVYSALSLLVHGEREVQILYRSIGALEAIIGLLLLSPPYLEWEMRIASVLTLGFVAY